MSDWAQTDQQPDLHPLNRDFSWEPHHPPFRALSPEQARQYDERGYVAVEGAFDEHQLQRVLAEIDPLEAGHEAWLRQRADNRVFISRAGELTFTVHIVTRSETLRRFVAAPPLADICADLVGPDARLYWDQAVYKKPDRRSSFPWHQDNGYAYVEPQQYLTCWIALSDATVENGCPWVVPGGHVRGTLWHRLTPDGWVCFEQPPQAVPVPLAAGSIAVFSSLTPHCTGPNRTDTVRKAYIVQYAPDGAEVLNTTSEGRIDRVRADDPGRQFPVLIGGALQSVDD